MSKIYATTALKNARLSRGYTLRQVADVLTLEMGDLISHSTIGKIENQEASMSAELTLEFSKLYRINVKAIMERR